MTEAFQKHRYVFVASIRILKSSTGRINVKLSTVTENVGKVKGRCRSLEVVKNRCMVSGVNQKTGLSFVLNLLNALVMLPSLLYCLDFRRFSQS